MITAQETLAKASKAIALFIVPMAAIFFSPSSHAEGLLCLSVDQDTRIEVYFGSTAGAQDANTQVHTMIVSDPTVAMKRQQIAKFLAADGLLAVQNGAIVGVIDPRNPNTARRGEHIGGTLLGALRSIALEVDFSRGMPVKGGMRHSAQVMYTKRNGQQLTQDFDCVRFQDEKIMALHIYDDVI
jgi:hypothetical protein